MAKPNYQFEKRQRELEKKKKKVEKAQRKASGYSGSDAPDGTDAPESQPDADPAATVEQADAPADQAKPAD